MSNAHALQASVLAVAVVVPVWNRARLVVNCLESIRAQTCVPKAVVVVDDGSTDGTAESVDAWIREHGHALGAALLRRPHAGAAAARNAGLDAIGDSPLVAFLDSDDCWPPDFLERAATALGRQPAAVAVSADRLRQDLRDQRSTLDCLVPLAQDPIQWMFSHDAGVGSSTVFRAASVRAAGRYPEQVATGHDCVLFCRIALLGPWLHCPGEPVTFLQHHALTSGQAGHIWEQYPEHELKWARMYQELADELGPAHLPAAFLRRTLDKWWCRAGAAMVRIERTREARRCYARAIRSRPWSRKAWKRLLRALLFARSTA
jgi:glycosyltransferase involved in cell wall biosynthesis